MQYHPETVRRNSETIITVCLKIICLKLIAILNTETSHDGYDMPR